MSGVGHVACQGFLVREACVGVLVGGAGTPVTSKAVPSVLASSVCWPLQCLISTLTQGGGGHFLRLTCSVLLWGGRNTANR